MLVPFVDRPRRQTGVNGRRETASEIREISAADRCIIVEQQSEWRISVIAHVLQSEVAGRREAGVLFRCDDGQPLRRIPIRTPALRVDDLVRDAGPSGPGGDCLYGAVSGGVIHENDALGSVISVE